MAKQTEKLKKRFGFSRKRMSIIKNIVLRDDMVRDYIVIDGMIK